MLAPLGVKCGLYLKLWCPIDRELAVSEDSFLEFATGSHRNVLLFYWFGNPTTHDTDQLLHQSYRVENTEFVAAGDCTTHHGWLLYRACEQPKEGRGTTATARRPYSLSRPTPRRFQTCAPRPSAEITPAASLAWKPRSSSRTGPTTHRHTRQ